MFKIIYLDINLCNWMQLCTLQEQLSRRMEELEAEKSKTEAHIQSLKKRKADLSVSMRPEALKQADDINNILVCFQYLALMLSLFLLEEEHRGDEAAGSRTLREHALYPEAGRAGRPGLSGAGPETDQDQTGPGSSELETTPGPGH